jgi:hypothetical protein
VRFLYRTADGNNSPQSIARIDRTFVNIAICRAFLRATLREVIDRQWIVIDRCPEYRPLIDLVEICCLAGLFLGDGSCGRCGRCSEEFFGTSLAHLSLGKGRY